MEMQRTACAAEAAKGIFLSNDATRQYACGQSMVTQEPMGRCNCRQREFVIDVGQAFLDAAKRDAVVRLKLQAEWTQSSGQAPVLCNAVVVELNEAALGSGARTLALAEEYNVYRSR